MKKNDVILSSAVLGYSILFYKQSAGINFLLFDLLLVALLLIGNKSLAKNSMWLIAAAGTLISGIATTLYGNGLCFIGSIISLLVLSSFSFSKNSSTLLALLYGMYSILSAVVFMFIDLITRRKNKERTETKKGKTLLAILISVFVLLFFFIMYREANPLFKEFTSKINLDFISLEWIRFTILGLILMYGFFYHRSIPALYNYDLSGKENNYILEHEKIKSNKISNWLGLSKELTLGISLFALLNVMILIVNSLDIVYLWLGEALPQNLDYSAAVHQSVGNLITSILAAIVLILFFFRAELNFIKNNKMLRLVAYLWILQNAVLVASTMYRNQMYIEEFALTQKRIGVYFYLLVCLAGLLSAGIKIYKNKRNWYLFRFNSMAIYMLLIVSLLFNWDKMITRYNLKHTTNLDYQYLVSLNYTNLPELELFFNSEPFFKQQENTILGNSNKIQLKNLTDHKLYNFFNESFNNDIRSWNYDNYQIKKSLIALVNQGSITELDLSGGVIQNIKSISDLKKLKKINLARNKFSTLGELSPFTSLNSLNLSGNSIKSIEPFPELKALTLLDLSVNSIKDFNTLSKCVNLETLNVSFNNLINIEALKNLDKLNNLNISNCAVLNAQVLSRLKSLKILNACNMPNAMVNEIPELNGIEELYISHNNISDTSLLLSQKLAKMKNLKLIDLSGNEIIFLDPYAFAKYSNSENVDVFQHLTSIDVSANKIIGTGDLSQLPLLTELNISYNQLYETGNITTAANLEKLFIQGNKINDFSALIKLNRLKSLDISANGSILLEKTLLPATLEYLNISACNLQQSEFLLQFTSLKSLNASNTGLKDLVPLAKLKMLTSLDVSYNSAIIDYSPLFTMKQLLTLRIPKVNDEMLQKLKKALPNTNIIICDERGTETSTSAQNDR